jgi:hypothetical protein
MPGFFVSGAFLRDARAGTPALPSCRTSTRPNSPTGELAEDATMSRFRGLILLLVGLALIAGTCAQAQNPTAPARDDAAAAQAPDTPQPQSTADRDAPRRNVWSTPLAGFAAAIGLTGLLARLGLNGSVAAAFGGVLLVAPLVVAAFFAWQFIRRRRVLDPDRARASRP